MLLTLIKIYRILAFRMELLRNNNAGSIALMSQSDLSNTKNGSNDDTMTRTNQKLFENLMENGPTWTVPDTTSEPVTVPVKPNRSYSSSSSSTGSSLQTISVVGALCGKCDVHAVNNRCIDCNDLLCDSCSTNHRKSSQDHCLVNLQTSPNAASPINYVYYREPVCQIHTEILRYLCETCKIVVCQECTLWEHRDHSCIPMKSLIEDAKNKIVAIIESGKLGTKYIKQGIDRAVIQSQNVERDSNEVCIKVKKAMRHFILAAEDRERVLLEQVEKYKIQKLSLLADQMTGLRSALSGT